MLNVEDLLEDISAFEKDAHTILGVHETSKSRVVLLEETYKDLKGLNLAQDELFRQSLRCIENGLFRAAHVMAWSGFMDYLELRLSNNGFAKLRAVRQKWKFKSLEDLREQQTEHALIEASKVSGLCSKSQMKALHGLLSKRNECAHPSSFFPGLNESLGYVSEIFKRIETLEAKTY